MRFVRKLSLKSSQGGYKSHDYMASRKDERGMQQQTAEVTGRASCHDCLLLVSEEPDAILQTIQSRTQRFNIHGIKEPEISKVLQTKYGLQPEDADDIAHRSEGNFLKSTGNHTSERGKQTVL
mgnify:CR=1 FL=1